MARHVATVALLLIVQGAFDLVVGLALTGMAVFVAAGQAAALAERLPVEPRIAAVLFGPALLAAGTLKIAAGIRNHSYRGRLLGMVALSSCAFSMTNCYCAPLSLALMVFGLIVYRHPDSARVFLMGGQGLSREWIDASAGANRPGPIRPR